MASVERPQFTGPIPPHARRITRDGKLYAAWTDRNRNAVEALILLSGKCRRIVPKKWIGIYRDHLGKKQKTDSYSDRSAALSAALEAEKQARDVKAGKAAPNQPSGISHLIDHLPDYLASLAGLDPKHIEGRAHDLRRTLTGAKITTAASVDTGKLDIWLEAERRTGNLRGTSEVKPELSARTKNRWIASLKAFGNWLEEQNFAPSNPFRRLKRANEAIDQRHVRRAIPESDLRNLITTTQASTVTRRGLTGADRAALYLTAAFSGFRFGALFALTPESFVSTGGKITGITAAAKTMKGRKPHSVPLPADVAKQLAEWLATKAPGKPVWQWTSYMAGCAPRVLRADLKASGIPYRNAVGEVFDFHALRGQYITMLVNAGNSAGVVQRLAGHSDPRQTARYTRLSQSDLQTGVDRLPSLGTPLGTEVGKTKVKVRKKSGAEGVAKKKRKG